MICFHNFTGLIRAGLGQVFWVLGWSRILGRYVCGCESLGEAFFVSCWGGEMVREGGLLRPGLGLLSSRLTIV